MEENFEVVDVVKVDVSEDNIRKSDMPILIPLAVLAGGVVGYLTPMVCSKVRSIIEARRNNNEVKTIQTEEKPIDKKKKA